MGAGFFGKVVAPRVFQAFKNETVKFKSVSVAPNREQIRQEVQEELDDQLEQVLNLQFEALQILKQAPPQIVFLPAG